MVAELRLTALRAAATNGARTVVYTSCYSHPHDLGFLAEMERVVEGAGGVIQPVHLQCSIAELERRIAESRSRGDEKAEKRRGSALGRARAMELGRRAARGLHKRSQPPAGTPGSCADEIIATLALASQVSLAGEATSLPDRGSRG